MKRLVLSLALAVSSVALAGPYADGDVVVFFGNRGQNVDDLAAFRAWHESNVKTGKAGECGCCFGKFIPGCLGYWPEYKAVRAALWRDQDAVREFAKPVPHAYEIVRVK